MILHNTSAKIISIGLNTIMPDEEMRITKAIADTPAIKALVARKYLSIEYEASDKPKAEKVEETETEEDTTTVKRTRRKKAAEETAEVTAE